MVEKGLNPNELCNLEQGVQSQTCIYHFKTESQLSRMLYILTSALWESGDSLHIHSLQSSLSLSLSLCFFFALFLLPLRSLCRLRSPNTPNIGISIYTDSPL